MRPRHAARRQNILYWLPGGSIASGPNTSPPTQLTVIVQPSGSVGLGVIFPQQPIIQVRDVTGTVVPQPGIVVTAAINTGSGTLQGTLTAITNAQGVATFIDLSIGGLTGSDQLIFTSPGLISALSTSITVTSTATKLGVDTQPSSSVTTGNPFPQQPVIQLLDVSGNPVHQSGISVTAAINTGTGVLEGQTVRVTDVNGKAAFVNLDILGLGTDTLIFTSSGLTSIVSNTITVTGATKLAIVTQPSSSATSGVAFAQQPVIVLQDAGGNQTPQPGISVTASRLSGADTLGGALTQVSDTNGLVTFTNLVLTGSGPSDTILFSSAGLTAVTSNTISVSSGARTYTTSFPTTENPLSEGGNWLEGFTDGIDFSDFRVTSGFAYGTQFAAEADSTAIVRGAWASDHFAEATVNIAHTPLYNTPELEIRLRTSITAHSITGYECTFSLAGAASVARWNGPIHSYNAFTPSYSHGFSPLTIGDVLRGEVIGNTINLYVNSVLVLVVDITSLGGTVYTNGGPGIGWNGDLADFPADLGSYGFSHFNAGELGGLDPLLQRFVNGDFTTLDIFEGSFPHPTTDTKLLTTGITGANVVSSSAVTLTLNNTTPTVLATSAATQPKYARLSTAGVAEYFYLSIGLSTDTFGPDIIVDDMAWFGGDTVNLTGFPVTAITEDIDHYAVTPSILNPGEGSAYTADIQTKNAANADLHRIGRRLTPTMTTISGGGGAVIAESSSITNRFGAGETLHITAGVGGSLERIDVVDQAGITGSSADIADGTLNAILTFTSIDALFFASSGAAYGRSGIVVTAGKHMLVRTHSVTADGTNTPTATGLTFVKIASHDFPVSGQTMAVFAAACPSGFSGTVNFSGGSPGRVSSQIMQVGTSVPVTALTVIAANTVNTEIWTGSAPSLIEISYMQTFSDPRNGGVAMYLEFGAINSSARSGWTESDDSIDGAVAVALHHRSSPDTKSGATYASNAAFVIGLAIELAAVPA